MRELDNDGALDDFRDFVLGSQVRLIKFAEFLTRDLGHAEDLVQHAYAKTFASWSKLRSGNPEAYARQCVISGHTDWWRRLGRRKEQPLEASIEPCDSADPATESAERDAVMRALGRLTRRERTVIALRFYSCLTTDEIAHEVGINAVTVRTTMHRALAKLRADENIARDGVRT